MKAARRSARIRRPGRARTAQALRPTTARVRDALFNSLASAVGGAHVLDLFSGTGALGLEALGRGAARVVFVEHDPRQARAITEAVVRGGYAGRATVRCEDVYGAVRRLAAEGAEFDLILLDPPYGEGRLTRAVAAAAAVLRVGGRIVAEGHWRDRPELPAGMTVVREARYGETALWFIKAAARQER